MLDVEVTSTIKADFGLLFGPAQTALDIQVVNDSNYFCPVDEGTLQRSALTASRFGSGEVKWNTPYASAQYWGLPNKSKDMNPNARMRWFEEANTLYAKDWCHTYGVQLVGGPQI